MIRRLAPLAFVLFLAANAHAGALPYRIEYQAPAGCSSRDDFVRELVARTPRVRAAEADEVAAAFLVELAQEDELVRGHLTLRERDGTETRRAVAGQTCEEVVPALALIAAVLVDPEALTRSQGSAAPVTPEPTPTPPPGPPPEAAPKREPERVPEPAPSRRTRLRFGGAGGGALETTVSPNTSFGWFAEVSVELEHAGRRGLSFGVGAERTTSNTVSTDAGDADFRFTAARGWFCPLSLPSTGMAALWPCAALEAGELYAEGSRTLNEQDASVFWLAAGPMLRAELRPVDFIGVFLDGMLVVPLVAPYHFRFDPSTPVYSTPFAGGSVRAGLRAALP